MSTMEGESTNGLPRWVHLEPAPEKAGWARLTIELRGKKVNLYVVDVKVADLKQHVERLGT